MRYAEICKVLGGYLYCLSAILLIPLCISLFYEYHLGDNFLPIPTSVAFAVTIFVSLVLGAIFSYSGRRGVGTMFAKESILLVILIWIVSAAIGAIPLYVTKMMDHPLDAYYEAMSALTTTGATLIQGKHYDAHGNEKKIRAQNPHNPSIIYSFYGTVNPIRNPKTGAIIREGLEALGRPLVFWISFMQWLGGIGVVIVFLAALPSVASGWKFLYESGVAGPSKESMTPRIKETVSILWKIYIGMTLAQIVILKIVNPDLRLFDAVTLTFTTISTGGFSIFSDGLAHYNHTGMLWVIAFFMIVGSLNFSLYYHGLKGKFSAWKDPELFVFLGTSLLAGSIMSLELWKAGFYPLLETIGYSFFQTISSQTSTGFAIVNYDHWPPSCQMLMLYLTFIGGMSGSTTGGIKIIRILIVFLVIRHQVIAFFRPKRVQILKLGQKEIAEKTANTVMTYICVLILITVFGVYLLILDNVDPITSFDVIASSINNAGCYFEGMGSTQPLSFLSDFGKSISILYMVLGRLELFSLFALLAPSFWSTR